MSKKQIVATDVAPRTDEEHLSQQEAAIMDIYPTVFNSLNYRLKVKDDERSDLPSETIPDRTLTVRQILDRYARGLSLGGSRVPIYDEDDEFPDLSKMDLADREAYIKERQDELAELKQRAKEREQNLQFFKQENEKKRLAEVDAARQAAEAATLPAK